MQPTRYDDMQRHVQHKICSGMLARQIRVEADPDDDVRFDEDRGVVDFSLLGERSELSDMSEQQ